VLVVWLGPSAHLEGAAVVQAALGAAAALIGAALVVAAVVASRARALHPGRPRRLPLGALPWELLLGWATVVSYQRLGDWGIPVGRGANVTRVDVLGLLFPVLFLVTAVAVLSRVLSLGLRPLRAISRSWPTALYLGVRRVARYRVAVLGLVAASALAAGVLGYAASMNRSLDATLGAKASTFVGSDLAVRVPPDAEVPDQLSDQATEVTLHWDAWIDAGERQKAAVIAIDPATFESAAFWDDTFADAPLRELVARLERPNRDSTVPAVVVGRGAVTGRAEVGIVSGGTKRFEVTALPDVRTFPGMRRPKITVFVAARSLEGLDLGPGRTELWVDGDRDRSLDALRSAGFGFSEERRAAEIADGASFVTVAWTFGFMLSLGLSAGLLVLGGVATYLDARRRDRLLGYAFMQRMGLRRGPHRRALLVELTASVVVGCWVGLGIALVAAWLAHSRIDPVPTYRPEPLLRPATSIVLGLALLALVLSVVGAVLAQRRADRDDAVEVLRAGV
jgi:putative ABC transport system permease protein